jgi:hypothetical protein
MQIRADVMGVDGRFRGFVPRRRPIFGLWLKFLNAVVRMLTFGKARVVLMRDVVHFRNWEGVIRRKIE